MCEKIGISPILDTVNQFMSSSKIPLQQKGVLQWEQSMIVDFGASAIDLPSFLRSLQTSYALKSSNPAVKSAATAILVELHHQLGPAVLSAIEQFDLPELQKKSIREALATVPAGTVNVASAAPAAAKPSDDNLRQTKTGAMAQLAQSSRSDANPLVSTSPRENAPRKPLAGNADSFIYTQDPLDPTQGVISSLPPTATSFATPWVQVETPSNTTQGVDDSLPLSDPASPTFPPTFSRVSLGVPAVPSEFLLSRQEALHPTHPPPTRIPPHPLPSSSRGSRFAGGFAVIAESPRCRFARNSRGIGAIGATK